MSVVWTVKGGRQGEREERLLAHGLLGGGWVQLPSLEDVSSVNELHQRYTNAYPDVSDKTASNYVGQLWSLVHRMQVGELVVLPLKTTGTIAVGRITADYAYRTDLGDDLRHVRSVTWDRTDVPRDAFDQDLLYSFGAFLTFAQVRRDQAEARVLKAVKAPGDTALPKPAAAIAMDGSEEAADVEDAPDVVALGLEQVRQLVTQRFAGHELTELWLLCLPPGASPECRPRHLVPIEVWTSSRALAHWAWMLLAWPSR